jgi:hypothetical protein
MAVGSRRSRTASLTIALSATVHLSALGSGCSTRAPSLGPRFPLQTDPSLLDIPAMMGAFPRAAFGGEPSGVQIVWTVGSGRGHPALPYPCKNVSAVDGEVDIYTSPGGDTLVVEGAAEPAALSAIEPHLGPPQALGGGWVERLVTHPPGASLFSWGAAVRVCAPGVVRDRIRGVLGMAPPRVIGVPSNVSSVLFSVRPPSGDPARPLVSMTEMRWPYGAKEVRDAIGRGETFVLTTQMIQCLRFARPEHAAAYEASERRRSSHVHASNGRFYYRSAVELCQVSEF